MESLTNLFQNSGSFRSNEGSDSPPRDRIRFTASAHKILARKQLDTSGGAGELIIDTIPTGEVWLARTLRLHNTSGSSVTVTLRDIPRGGANSSVHNWFVVELAPSETFYATEIDDVLEPGYTLRGFASTGNVVNLKLVGIILADS
jgi:hypothetical protein